MLIARRGLLVAGASAAMARPAWAQSLSQGAFTHGVASGDPLADGVIIWTRFVGGDGRIAWEVAEDESVATIAARGEAQATLASDFCVKADVRGLQPGRVYFYRFLAGSGPSLTGCTRTAPTDASSLKVGLVSCANYAFGYFHAYGHLAERDDIDLVLHTGDYIYEYGADEYPKTELTVAGRAVDPDHEIVTLDDYYRRYQQYHTDPNLLALRAAKPISAVWDDHEIANDSTSTGAQNHQSSEGTYADRVAAATKAYFDWMPIRRPEQTGIRLYRTLDWGNLARIILLDTRLIGRVRQLSYQRALGLHLLSDGAGMQAAVEEFRRTQLLDPARTCSARIRKRGWRKRCSLVETTRPDMASRGAANRDGRAARRHGRRGDGLTRCARQHAALRDGRRTAWAHAHAVEFGFMGRIPRRARAVPASLRGERSQRRCSRRR
ncbi:MAG: alkaline phosphatase D family protein [Caulobacteraceae bacterium]|nr:alkaline phosphatase D family protein [Caulobacteraceae bacterium]